MRNNPFFQYHRKLFDALPGQSKRQFFLIEDSNAADNVKHIWLHGLQEFFDSFQLSCDTIILNIEIWHYPEVEKIIAQHSKLKDKSVFVVTLGYRQYQFGPNCWLLSYPWFTIKQTYQPTQFEFKEKNLPYGFGSLNGRPAVHRILLGYHLHQQKLLSKVLFTQHKTPQDKLDADIYNTLPNFAEYESLLPILPNNEIYTNDHELLHPSYWKTYCNIVTETETEEVPYSSGIDIEIITEKSAKPFIAKQVPLFLAGRGHLAYLRYLGFETMEDLTPTGYDQMSTLDKISAIVNIVSQGRDYIEAFYFDHLRELQHNYDLMWSDSIETKLLKDVKSLLY